MDQINQRREAVITEASNNKESVFHLPIKNTLGLDNLKAKAVLKAYALQHPSEYTKARAEAYSTIVETMVETNYEIIWNLLKSGIISDSKTIFNDVAELKSWSPNLQDAEIAKLATGYSEQILDLFDGIFEKICPSDYKAMAEDKLTNIAKLDLISK